MKRAFLYVRVSTAEQRDHGLSVDNQIDALQAYCKDNNYEVVKIFNDAGFSASKSYKSRPALQEMLNACERREADILLFTKLDRFFRSVPDYYVCMERMNGIPWRAIWEDYETETSAGQFKVNIMLSIAQAESQRTSERIKAVMAYKRARGDFLGGNAPLGYTIRNKMLEIDEETAPAVRAFFREYLSTFTQGCAIRAAQEHGVKIINTKANRMLRSEAYAGNANGCKCPAYITQEEHLLILKNLSSRATTSATERIYIFSGLVVCAECGRRMEGHTVTSVQKNRRYKYKTYRCGNGRQQVGCTNKKHIMESTLERYMLAQLDDLLTSEIASVKLSNGIKKDAHKRIQSLEQKLVRIGERYEDGDITREEYIKKRNDTKAELTKLQQPTKQIADLTLPSNWKDIYSELDELHRQSFWKRYVNHIVARDRTDISVEL